VAQIKEIVEQVMETQNLSRMRDDFDRFLMYNGKIKEVIKKAIAKEFKKPETVIELERRIIPVNIMQKIINKLASVYQQPAIRNPKDKDPNDQELIDLYEESFMINQKMKFANRYFKLHKHTVLEPFLDRDGVPRLRALPSQTYTPLSDDPVQPERMTTFVKHIKTDRENPKDARFQIWTEDQFVISNGLGEVVMDDMIALNNPEGVNPFGVIPFTYISENDDGNLIPISDDDLVSMQIAIDLLLSDLAFASKYQLWSILAVVGADSENIDFNPNSILSLPAGASVDVIKPDLDSDKALAMVEQLVGLLLTTKNLSVGDVTGQMRSRDVVSGVSKMLDSAETTEDRKDQQAFFSNAEKDLWQKFAHNILPIWVDQGRVAPRFAGSFSPEFELSIRFADPRPFIGDRERVELEEKKLNNDFTTREMALRVIHPELDSEQIFQLQETIGKEKKERVQDALRAMQEAPVIQSEEEDQGDGA
jgi:hypothetical protein